MRGIKYISILILLVSALLFFGCLGAPQQQPHNTSSGEQVNNTSSSGTTSSGAISSGTTSSGEQVNNSENNSETQSSGGSTSSEGNNLEGLTYDALIALGQPLVCTVAVEDVDGSIMTEVVYVGGEHLVRAEISGRSVSGEDFRCDKVVYIFKENASYLGCEGGNLFGNDCDWLEMYQYQQTPGSSSGEGEPQASSGFEAPNLEDVPPANIHCEPWTYDASKFETPGKVCNFTDLMAGYNPNQ